MMLLHPSIQVHTSTLNGFSRKKNLLGVILPTLMASAWSQFTKSLPASNLKMHFLIRLPLNFASNQNTAWGLERADFNAFEACESILCQKKTTSWHADGLQLPLSFIIWLLMLREVLQADVGGMSIHMQMSLRVEGQHIMLLMKEMRVNDRG